ncbi:hypothetical protein PPGU19_085880 (plasmid) [Paraburkholderia sp. PGU19]|nr:hypothetical protein PPGU19_085880 [Paraburkholderia sp. PGU19]
MDIFIQQVLNGLVLGSVYAIIALGYTMVYGILGIINFAHGDVLMVGAMVALSAIGVLQNHFPVLETCRLCASRWASPRVPAQRWAIRSSGLPTGLCAALRSSRP